MGTHIHVGTANRRNALALLLLALAMLFNTAVPAMAQKNMTGALKKKNLLGKGNFSKAAAAVMVGSALYQSFDKQKSKTTTKAVTPPDSPDPNVKLTSGRQVTDLFYDDETDNTARQLQQLRRLYPDEDFMEGDQGMMVKVTYLKCEKVLAANKPHQLRLSFYHDKQRKDKCKFYEIVDEFDKLGNNRVFATASDDGCAVSGDQRITCASHQLWSHAREVNFMRKNRKSLSSFETFVPEYIYSFADPRDPYKNDTIFMFADIYDEVGRELVSGTYYVSWVREANQKDNTCYHPDRDTTEYVKSRTNLGDCIILVKYDRSWRCKICGHKEFEPDLERTETDPNCEKKTGEHQHVWNYLEEQPDFNSLKRETSQNQCYMMETWNIKVTRQCLICGLKQSDDLEDATVVPNASAPMNKECCPGGVYKEEVEEKPAERVGDRMKMDKVISTYFYCPDNDTKQLVGQRTETEWSEPCLHDFRLVSTEDLGANPVSKYYHHAVFVDHYRCIKCGMLKDIRRTKNCSHKNVKTGKFCKIVKPWIESFKGVPLRMRLVVYPQDTTAVYVAETETTQQLWGAVCPDNRHGWKIDSKYPATGVTREEVDAFISRLNTMAAEQGVPLRFRLPEAEEWASTYIQCGEIMGWVYEYGNAMHHVAELPANCQGLYDMKGNVSEMCSDTISSGDPGYETVMTAVAGKSYADTSHRHPATYQWLDMQEGRQDVGFRIFADPIDGDEAQIKDITDAETESGFKESIVNRFGGGKVKVGDLWLTCNRYQCEDCGYISYGSKWHFPALNGKKPIGCK